ncbi:ABC transporter permease [uncultured Aureimonas sp.]|uniref:ABC transporter permease n=1 Tax=uncultured Aureimonas sp. TaxID=1604662 RepID=UPI0025D34D13|nr:ABC transporter permease [uncultured Aureimonas sp.]
MTALRLKPSRRGLGALLLRRLVLGLLTLLAVSALIFAGTQILPGDVASAMLGQQATPEAVAAIRAQLGLDQLAALRYLEWLGGILQGDLGLSSSNRQDIAASIAPRLENTLFLAGTAALVATPLALVLGWISVLYRDRWPDRAINIVTLGAISLPEFFVGYLLIATVAVQWNWFATSAVVHDGMTLLERLDAIALPAFTLVLAVLGHMMRMTRAALINVLSAPYIETARLKGLPPSRVLLRHALPNVLGPILNVVLLNVAYLVVGVVVVEVIFVYPGMGQYMIDHVTKRDVPVVQACGLIFAGVYIGLNILADILAILVNPRLRVPR